MPQPTRTMNRIKKHQVEDSKSWNSHLERLGSVEQIVTKENEQRELKKKHKHHKKILSEADHGMMIDAGSRGSRMHVFQFGARVLQHRQDVENVVSGRRLSYPTSDSRWTNRLRPGLASLSELPDDALLQGVAEYLQPLIDFAKDVLKSKEDEFRKYPIFLKATAGMRVLELDDRTRVMNAVRTLFQNKTYCPFKFKLEQARVLSGEEEAIFGWTGINYLMGALLSDSEGAGTVANPKLTYGALDMGGASTQISFFEPNGDIMSNLFKLQIGQGKHWNIYAHSFLYYGIVEATHRFEARLSAGKRPNQRLIDGVYNPCLPGGATKSVRTAIHLDIRGLETWDYDKDATPEDDGYYEILLKNDMDTGDFSKCMEIAYDLLHKEQNSWCKFSHRGACSFAGIYQPNLPRQSANFGEFFAFSNYYHVWEFLQLPSRVTLEEMKEKLRTVCSMSEKDLQTYNDNIISEDELNDYCFRSVYAYQLLRHGYGFQDEDAITCSDVIGGQKVGWALGSMIYEINTLPWRMNTTSIAFSEDSEEEEDEDFSSTDDLWSSNGNKMNDNENMELLSRSTGDSDLQLTNHQDRATWASSAPFAAFAIIVAVYVGFLWGRMSHRHYRQGYECVGDGSSKGSEVI